MIKVPLIFLLSFVGLLLHSPSIKAASFVAMACNVLTDASARTECENYATTFVTDLSPANLSALINEELNNVSKTMDLMQFSQLTTLGDLREMTLSNLLDSEILKASDFDLSGKLEELVNAKYSEDFLDGLSEISLKSLYETEFHNMKGLLDFTGVNGDAATKSDITIIHEGKCLDANDVEISCIGVDANGDIFNIPHSIPAVTHVITASGVDMGTEVNTEISTHTTTEEEYNPNKANINTLEIITGTIDASMNCLSWGFRGVCVWIKWTMFGPKIQTSIKVENFVPELTFQSYDDGKAIPWDEAKTLMSISGTDSSGVFSRALSSLMGATGAYKNLGGGNNDAKGSNSRSKTMFKIVDAFGNPAQLVFESTYGNLEAFCTPTTTMFMPYYISNLDATNWRQHFGSEFLDVRSWIPGTYMLGSYSSNNHYGSIYPRIGATVTADPIKAAVLMTFRAAHFITRENQLHVYQSIYQSYKDGVWISNELDEDDGDTGKFQQLLPYKESKCQTFPLERNPDGKRRGETGSTVWNFWRKVTCCKKRGSVLLYHT